MHFATQQQHNLHLRPTMTMWHDDCWQYWRGAFNNQQGWEAATKGSGGGAEEEDDGDDDNNDNGNNDRLARNN